MPSPGEYKSLQDVHKHLDLHSPPGWYQGETPQKWASQVKAGVPSPKFTWDRKQRENKADRTKQRGVTDRKEKLKTADSSLLEYGAGTVRGADKRRHVLHSRWRKVLILALQSCLLRDRLSNKIRYKEEEGKKPKSGILMS